MSDISGAPAAPAAAPVATPAAPAAPAPAAPAAAAPAAAAPAATDPAAIAAAAAAAAADPAAAAAAAAQAGTPPGTPGDGTADPNAVGAPETYTDFTLPEGMEMNVEQLAVFAPMAKDLGLTQEQAQQLVTLDATQKVAAEQVRQQAVDDMLDGWRETTKMDPTLGGANLQQSLAYTSTFLNKFASPELRQLLDDTGVGNHLEVIRLFAAAGKAMGEDGVIGSGLNTPAKKTPEQLLYPNQAP